MQTLSMLLPEKIQGLVAGLGSQGKNNLVFGGAVDPKGRDLPEFKSQPHRLVFLGLHFFIFKMGENTVK